MSIVGRALAQSVEESSVVCTPNHANGSGPLPQANKAFQPPPPPRWVNCHLVHRLDTAIH